MSSVSLKIALLSAGMLTAVRRSGTTASARTNENGSRMNKRVRTQAGGQSAGPITRSAAAAAGTSGDGEEQDENASLTANSQRPVSGNVTDKKKRRQLAPRRSAETFPPAVSVPKLKGCRDPSTRCRGIAHTCAASLPLRDIYEGDSSQQPGKTCSVIKGMAHDVVQVCHTAGACVPLLLHDSSPRPGQGMQHPPAVLHSDGLCQVGLQPSYKAASGYLSLLSMRPPYRSAGLLIRT